MRPGGLVFISHPEQGFRNAESVFCTLAEEELAVDIAYYMSAENTFPVVVISYYGSEISKDDDDFVNNLINRRTALWRCLGSCVWVRTH